MTITSDCYWSASPRLGLRGLVQISKDTVQRYVNAQAEVVIQQVEVSAKPKKRLTVQMDELWSFGDDLGNEQWVWLAIDARTREIVGVQVGDRSAVKGSSLVEFNAAGISAMCSDLH